MKTKYLSFTTPSLTVNTEPDKPHEDNNNTIIKKIKKKEKLLNQTLFTHITIENADLSDSDLKDVNFTYATFKDVKLNRATNFSKAKWASATLENIDFTGVDLDGADFSNAAIVNARGLNHAKNFNKAKWNSTKFINTKLADVDFHGVKFYKTVFDNSPLEFVKNLNNATFEGITLSYRSL